MQAGVEFALSSRLSLYNELGIKYRKGYYEDSDSSFFDSKGYKCKTEIRYSIFRPKRRLQNVYFALNAFYHHNIYNTALSYYYQKDSLDERTEGFGAKKTVVGFNVVLGLKQKI